jgi:glycosyltransferase involved in cell wall biosynthesis
VPKVSVILPTYNCARYLPVSIESVLSQGRADLELLVIDDGSTDDTKEIIRRYQSRPEIIYIYQVHAGLAAARNTGLKNARGEYITFIDADDIFCDHRIEKQVSLLDGRRQVDVAYTAWRYFYDDDKEHGIPSPYAKFSGDILFFLKRGNFIPIVTAMVRRSSLGDIRFDESLPSHEDWDFWLKLAGTGKNFFCLSEELTMIRVRKSSMTYVHSVMDESRSLVGRRAKEVWKAVKRRDYLRYIRLRIKALAVNFPNAPRFNRPSPFARQ